MEKHWPSDYERQTSASWTQKYPRPKDDGTHHPAMLEDRQRQWDAAEQRRQQQAAMAQKIRDDRESKRQAERDAAAAKEEERRQKKSAETEEMLRKRYLATGATQSEWESERTAIIAEYRRSQVAAGDAQEAAKRAAQAILYRSL